MSALRFLLHKQFGLASLGIVFLLFFLVLGGIGASFVLTQNVVMDGAGSDQRLQALLLAESGLERTSRRLVTDGIACGLLAETQTSAQGSISVSAGISSGASCTVRVTGLTAFGGASRTIETVLALTSGLSSTSVSKSKSQSQSFTCSVPSAPNLIVIIGVSWVTVANNNPSVVSVQNVTLGTQTATSAASSVSATASVADGASSNAKTTVVSAQNFYLLNPPTGASVSGTVNFSSAPDGLIVGCLTLAGASQTAPIGATAAAVGTSAAPSVTISTGTTSTYVVDNLVRNNGGVLSMNAGASPTRTQMWNYTSNNSAGAGSYRGPFSAVTPVTMGWSWNQSDIWAIAALTVQASSSGSTVYRPNSLLSWREVTVVPP